VNGVDVTNARHDEVIWLLTSDKCSEFTIVVYRDPDHPLSPTASPRSHLFMPSQPPVNVTTASPHHTSSAVTKRPSPGPRLVISPSPRSSAAGFVPRPTSADVGGRFSPAVDGGRSPPTGVKTVTYSIGDPTSASVEPPMPVMKMGPDKPSVRSSSGVDGSTVPSRDGNLLFVTPPAPPRTSTGCGVNDLFDALEKTYHASQQGRTSYDAGVRSSAMLGQSSSVPSSDKKRLSLEVSHHQHRH